MWQENVLFLHICSIITGFSPVLPPVFPRMPPKKEQGCWRVISGHVWLQSLEHIKPNSWQHCDKCLALLLSFFFHHVRIGRFWKKLLLWSERHWRNPPISLTKNLFSILFSFLSPIYIYLRNKFTMGYLSKKNANIVQGARENVWAQLCYRGVYLNGLSGF